MKLADCASRPRFGMIRISTIRTLPVALKNGVVVLQGFCLQGEWDLLHAIRIAKSAAGGGRVVDDLYLELGGRR